MGLVDYVKGLFDNSLVMKALIVYPNKKLIIKNVNVKDYKFSMDDKSFLIDEKAIYFYKKKPILLYHYNNASPLIISNDKIKGSVSSDEIKALVSNNIVKDIISGSETNDMLFYAAVAAAILSLISVLIQFGVIKVG